MLSLHQLLLRKELKQYQTVWTVTFTGMFIDCAEKNFVNYIFFKLKGLDNMKHVHHKIRFYLLNIGNKKVCVS